VSQLSDDKQTINEGRKKPLKGVDASLRDQIAEKLYDKCVELNIGQKVSEMWSKHTMNRATWLERQKVYLASWNESLISDTGGAFEGSSQLHIPMPYIVCKTLHARYNQAIWQDPPFNIKARTEALKDRVPVVGDTIRYYLMDGCNYHKGVEEIADKFVWDWITRGTGLGKIRWDVKYTRFVDVKTKTVPGAPKITTDPNTGKTTAVSPPKQIEVEEAVTKKVFEGPVWELKDLEDVLIIGNPDPDLAEAVLDREWLTASDMWTLADRKIFKADIVEEIIEQGHDYMEGALGSDLKVQKTQDAGKARLDGEKELDRYQIIEAYLQTDVDGSGINSDIVVWVHLRSKKILRATYLYRISPTGERPYFKAGFQPRAGQEYDAGLPELLFPLSQELDALHNMRIDFGLISTMPFGFYRATSGIDPETIQLEPGALIPVDNPQTDVYFPQLGNRTVFGMQEEQAINTMVERITSISDINMGIMNGQGATRTATGTKFLAGEMSSNLDVFLRRLNRGWKKALRYNFHLLQKRIPPGTSFRITGDDGADYWRTVSTDDISGDYDIELSPNSASSNPQMTQDQAAQILQTTMNPMLIQMGLVAPGNIYEAVKNNMIALGVKDWGRYITKPQGYSLQMNPLQEMDALLAGVPVPVTPTMDHQGYLDLYQHFLEDDQLHGQFNPAQWQVLTVQAKQHEAMMQALQQQQGQQNNINQMKLNAQQNMQGAQPSPGAPPQAPGLGANMGPNQGIQPQGPVGSAPAPNAINPQLGGTSV
jgi:hypothetical protein